MAKGQGYIRAATPELRFWACFAVVFALFAQAFFPAQVMAQPGRGDSAIVFCTGNDAPVIDAGGKIVTHKSGVNGLKCADCVLASITAVQAAEVPVVPVVYTVAHVDHVAAIAASPVKARAPPRPFSCGPPTLLQS